MTDCPRPLDPLDSEALASGDAPVVAGDAAAHAASCSSCGRAVSEARAFLAEIGEGSEPPGGVPDLASRVVRIRPFSRRERRDARLWAGPVSLSAGLFAVGVGILAAPGLNARDQAGLSFALLAPVAGLFRAGWRLAAETLSAVPAGWSALGNAARLESALGLTALLLLIPAGYALTRVLARAPRRG